MVKKLLNFFHQECGGLHQAAAVLALSSVVSSLLALFRDRLLAGTFGAGQTLDIYYAAFKVPDFIYILSMFLSSNTVLIPFFLERANTSPEKAKKFFDNIFNLFLILMTALDVVAFFAMPKLAGLVAPGFSQKALEQLTLVSRILLLSPLFIGLSNLVSVVTQAFNRFFLYALCPIVYNLGIIAGILFFAPKWGSAGIAVGVAIGAFLHFAIQLPIIARVGFFPALRTNLNLSEAWRVFKSSFARTFGLTLSQIVSVFVTAAASTFAVGSIAVYNFSNNLQAVPLSVIGLSYSVAAFPVLSKFFVNNRREEFMDHLVIASRQIIFWSIPLSVAIVVLRAQIVRVILGYGKFNWNDTRLTAAALAIFSISVVAQSLALLFTRAFYAAGKTAKPVLINALASLAIIGAVRLVIKVPAYNFFNGLWFLELLRVSDITGTEMLALPWIISLGAVLNAILLIWFFRNEFGHIWSRIGRAFGQSLFASLAMGTVIYSTLNYFDLVFNADGNGEFLKTFVGIFTQGFTAALAGGIVWFLLLHFMRNEELFAFIGSVRKKFWRATDVVGAEPKDLGM